MKTKKIGILVIMLLIATALPAVGTMKNESSTSIMPVIDNQIGDSGLSLFQDNVVLWDNYVLEWNIAYHSQDDPPDEPQQWDSFVVDDFLFEEETVVDWIFWQIYYGYCNNAEGPKDYHYDWNITFFEDDGTGNGPGDIYVGPITIADEDIDKSLPYFNISEDPGGWACGATTFLLESITFDADIKYWISIYSIGPIYPQTYFPLHNEPTGGILLHEAKFRSEQWGYPDWTDFTVVEGEPLDSNFVLGGDPPFEITIKKGIGVTVDIKNNLPLLEESIKNLTVTFSATGGIVLNPTKTFVISEFEEGTTETFRWFPIGFGSISIDVYATSEDVGIGDLQETGTLLLFFVL